MRRRGYSEHKRFSITAGGMVARISVFNEHGHEFWREVDAEGRGYRDRVHGALELIDEAMRLGCDPGEVRVAA